MNFHVITLFPEVIDAYAGASILGRAQKDKKITIKSYHLRDFVTNKWGKADERPYGGGPGMVLQAEPFVRAVEKLRKKNPKAKVLITAAGGVPLTHAYAKKLTKQKDVIILCGRYEGIDALVKKILKAEEVSVGPYILTGGELPALTIIDTAALDLFLRMQAVFGEHVPHEMGVSDLELTVHRLAESGEDTEEFDYAAFVAR